MEEEKKKTKEVEIKTKSPMWVVVLVAVLVIALACEFVYIRKLKNVNQEQTQIQAEQTEGKTSEVVEEKTEEVEDKNEKSNYEEFIGKWRAEIGPDGCFDITIKEDDGKLSIKWISEEFNTTPEKDYTVKDYSVNNGKLYVELEKNEYYPENEFIIYNKNDKLYLTIEKEKDTYFPVEMVEIK